MSLKRVLLDVAVKALGCLPPDVVLRLLLRADRWLYYLQGQFAVAYDGGVHTKHRHTGYHDFFVERIRAGERVLDVGGGNGALAYDIAERAGGRVVCIDVNPARIAVAYREHAHPHIVYCVGDATQWFVAEHFDVVVLSNVLEHIAERTRFLLDLQERVAPDRVLVRVPLLERDWRVPLKRELGVEWRLDPTHETEYTIESFAKEMTSASLTIVYQEIRWGEIWAEVAPS